MSKFKPGDVIVYNWTEIMLITDVQELFYSIFNFRNTLHYSIKWVDRNCEYYVL
jgi:hypothetical protein